MGTTSTRSRTTPLNSHLMERIRGLGRVNAKRLPFAADEMQSFHFRRAATPGGEKRSNCGSASGTSALLQRKPFRSPCASLTWRSRPQHLASLLRTRLKPHHTEYVPAKDRFAATPYIRNRYGPWLLTALVLTFVIEPHMRRASYGDPTDPRPSPLRSKRTTSQTRRPWEFADTPLTRIANKTILLGFLACPRISVSFRK
jgi:hypothetical protein